MENVNKHDVSDDFTLFDAIQEARRCLNCKKPTCKEGCPISNDIPEFIHELAYGNLGAARDIIARKSNLPAVCGRVCPHELQCEGHCVLRKAGKHIRIGRIEQFIADFAFDMKVPHPKIESKTRGKVAIIGSGPAGLTVAGDLAMQGFAVTVFERQPEPGGILLYGIPAFRLPKDVVRREISQMEALGVDFQTNSTVGVDFTVDDLFEKSFDAVFIGTGAAIANELDLPNKELHGIMTASYLLRMISLYNSGQVDIKEVPINKDGTAIVIGGGNVAMDAARSLVSMGVKDVKVVYRKKEEDMSATKAEYDSTIADGVEFIWEHSPLEYVGNENVEGLKVNSPDGEKVLKADMVYLAVGSRPANRIVSTTEGIGIDDRGHVITKEHPYGMTTRKGIFAGGDVVHKPATVVLAMKEAKKVAKGIAAYVDAIKLIESC